MVSESPFALSGGAWHPFSPRKGAWLPLGKGVEGTGLSGALLNPFTSSRAAVTRSLNARDKFSGAK